MKTLLLKFAGPLQSWGTDSHFETRHTDQYPSKSAVIGLLAACLGYQRNDDSDIQHLNDLDYAVRVDQTGQTIRDYQTVKKYKKNGELDRNYVTNRYYLEDAVFIAAVSSSDSRWIDEIAEAVKNPYFQPFLGRRSCPPQADIFLGVNEKGAVAALTELPWQASTWYQRKHNNHVPLYADSYLLESNRANYRYDYVISFSQERGRKFRMRQESVIYVDVHSEFEHDAFEALGDQL